MVWHCSVAGAGPKTFKVIPKKVRRMAKKHKKILKSTKHAMIIVVITDNFSSTLIKKNNLKSMIRTRMTRRVLQATCFGPITNWK